MQAAQGNLKPKGVPALGFSIGANPKVPSLSIGGLGMSTLITDKNTKTAEELDVEATVQAGKQPRL